MGEVSVESTITRVLTMQPIKLAFYRGNKFKNKSASWLDMLVCIATASPYSHVELIYDYSHTTKTAQVWSSSPIDGGVRKTTIVLNPEHWDVFEFRDFYVSNHIHQWFSMHEGKKYDWVGAIGVKFKLFRQDNHKWFCSEIIASYLGLKRPHRHSPIQLYRTLKPRLRKLKIG